MVKNRYWNSRVFFLFAAVVVITLSGCGSQKKAVMEPIFFPPKPDPPRLQYLMGISSSQDVEEEVDKFSFFVTKNEETQGVRIIGKPYGVTAAKGKIYVADSGASRIIVIDLAKKKFDYLKGAVGAGSLKKPINLTVDSDGILYVADTFRREVMAYDAEGNFLRSYGRDLSMKPTDVAVDGDSLYVLDITANAIKVLDKKTGELLRVIGKGDENKPGLSIPTNMAMDGAGNIYVTNIGEGNVMKLDRDGHVLSTFGKMGDAFGEFGRPKGITVDHAGRIYIVDASHQNVQIFNEVGRLLLYFGAPGGAYTTGSLNLPAGVATTQDNLEYFQKLAAPDFKLESVVLVTSQFGKDKLIVYGLGEKKVSESGGDAGKK